MKSLIALLLSAVLFVPLPGRTANTVPAPTVLATTVDALGYPSGLTFDATSLPRERALLFLLPREMPVKGAELRLVYRGSPLLTREASLSIAFNEQPPQSLMLSADDVTREWLLPVPADELGGGQLKVTVRGNIPVDYGTIIQGEPQSGMVHILPQTSLVSQVAGAPQTLRDAWLTLPEEVVVTVPHGTLDETTFRAALDWVTLLQRQHHTVRISTLPELGHLVIAPEAEIIAAMTELSPQTAVATLYQGKRGSNIGVVRVGAKSFIAVTKPYADAQRFATTWTELAQPLHLDSTPYSTGKALPSRLPMEILGLSTEQALLGHKLQWSAAITPWNTPPGMRPESATLYLLMPKTEAQRRFRLFVYLNGKMVMSKRFAGDGEQREIFVPFASVPDSNSYHLRMVVRTDGAKDANKPVQMYPIRVTAQSHILLKRAQRRTTGFAALPSALGAGFDLYVPGNYLAATRRYLPMVGRLLVGFSVMPADYKLIVLEPGQQPAPWRSFIVVGEQPPQGAEPPLTFHEGKVRLVDYRGESLFNETQLHLNSIIQQVEANGISGLWFHPGEITGMPAIDADRLGNDDLAIFEPHHLALSIDSHQEDLVRLQYLEHPRWYERLYEQRMLWLQLAWLLLTAGVGYLYVKSRQHRNG